VLAAGAATAGGVACSDVCSSGSALTAMTGATSFAEPIGNSCIRKTETSGGAGACTLAADVAPVAARGAAE